MSQLQNTAAYRAVAHLMRRMEADPYLAWHLHPNTEAFQLLIEAESEHCGAPVSRIARVFQSRLKPKSPAHRRPCVAAMTTGRVVAIVLAASLLTAVLDTGLAALHRVFVERQADSRARTALAARQCAELSQSPVTGDPR